MTLTDSNLLTSARPLVTLERRGVPEIRLDGLYQVKRQGKGPIGTDPKALVVMRSLLKPWQFLAADVAGDEDFWCLGLSSHSGQAEHMERLAELSRVAGAGEEELYCPRVFPLDWQTAARLRLSGEKPSRLHHPCAGKHLTMIASCRKHGDPIRDYFNSDHPAQKRVRSLIGQQVGERVHWMTDSCGVPTAAVSTQGLMALWERLALDDDEATTRMIRLWTANPRLAGGTDRLDSELMQVGEGRLIAKEGADGLLFLQSLPSDGAPVAGVFIKVASGYHVSHLALALWSVLSRTEGLPPVFSDVTDYLRSRLEKWVPGDQSLVLPPLP